MDDNSSTKAQAIKKAHDDLTSTFQKLEKLYDDVHIDESMRAERFLQICNKQNDFHQKIFTAEEQFIHSDELLVRRRKAVNDLRALFNEDNFDESSFVPGSLALVKSLHEEFNRLSRKLDQGLKIKKEPYSNHELIEAKQHHKNINLNNNNTVNSSALIDKWENKDNGWGSKDNGWGSTNNNNNDFHQHEEKPKIDNLYGMSKPKDDSNVNGWGSANNCWDNVDNISNKEDNIKHDKPTFGHKRDFGKSSNNNNNNWGNNDRQRGGNDRGRSYRGGRQNFYSRKDNNDSSANRNSNYNNNVNRSRSKNDFNEDVIVEKKWTNKNNNNSNNNNNYSGSNNFGHRSGSNINYRTALPLFPASTNNNSGPIFRGRGRGGGGGGSSAIQRKGGDELQQKSEIEQNNNKNINQRNDETDGSDGHEDEQKQQQQQNFDATNYGQLPKGVTLKDDPFEFKNNPAGERFDNPPSKVIYITNLPGEVNKNDLFSMLFSKKINIIDCDIHRYARCNNNNDANAYAFAELGSEEEAKKAIELLNEIEFMNRKLQVFYSRKPTINMNTRMMREAKRRRNNGGGFMNGGDTNSVVSVSVFNNNNNNDGWDFGINNNVGRQSLDSFNDKNEENEIINSDVLKNEKVDNNEEEKCLVNVDDDQEKKNCEENEINIEIIKLIETLVDNVCDEIEKEEGGNNNNTITPFSSTESLFKNDDDNDDNTPFVSIESLVDKKEENEEID